jgi:hypothetical protein
MMGQLVRGLLLTVAVIGILTGTAGLRTVEALSGGFLIAIGATAVYGLHRWSKVATTPEAGKAAATNVRVGWQLVSLQ